MRRYIVVVLLLFFSELSNAQIKLTLTECENLFQKNNLLLLASQFDINAGKAAVIQARIWEQPYLSGELNLLNPSANRVFDISGKGQKALAVEQLIYLGGKKKKEVDLAKSNVSLAELDYEQLIRNLNYELHRNFYEIYFGQKKIQSIQAHLAKLDTLINAYCVQVEKGNIPLKDLVRLQSLSLSFKNELIDIQKQIFDQQENLKILINSNENVDPQADETQLDSRILRPIVNTEAYLLEKALEKNPQILSAVNQIENAGLNLTYQKSLSKPDVTLGASYDQSGGAFRNQVNLTFGIPIPFKNRNLGNIKIAESKVSQSNVLKDQKILEIKSRIVTEVNNLKYNQSNYNQAISSFNNFEKVSSGLLKNFQNRNISMLEFTDFMESYNQNILFINDLKKQVILSGETLNFLTNDQIF